MPQPTKRIQNATARTTEGGKVGVETSLSQRERGLSTSQSGPKPRGRPKGAKNRPKGLMPKELLADILPDLRDMLPPEQFEYMKGVVKDGKPISTKNEMSILILLLSRNLYPALLLEALPKKNAPKAASDFFEDESEDGSEPESQPEETGPVIPEFRKDVTERLKVLQSLLASYERLERGEKESDNGQDTILKLTVKRGFDTGRFLKLVGGESGPVAGDADTVEGDSDYVGDLPDQTVERPLLLQGSEQGEADRS